MFKLRLFHYQKSAWWRYRYFIALLSTIFIGSFLVWSASSLNLLPGWNEYNENTIVKPSDIKIATANKNNTDIESAWGILSSATPQFCNLKNGPGWLPKCGNADLLAAWVYTSSLNGGNICITDEAPVFNKELEVCVACITDADCPAEKSLCTGKDKNTACSACDSSKSLFCGDDKKKVCTKDNECIVCTVDNPNTPTNEDDCDTGFTCTAGSGGNKCETTIEYIYFVINNLENRTSPAVVVKINETIDIFFRGISCDSSIYSFDFKEGSNSWPISPYVSFTCNENTKIWSSDIPLPTTTSSSSTSSGSGNTTSSLTEEEKTKILKTWTITAKNSSTSKSSSKTITFACNSDNCEKTLCKNEECTDVCGKKIPGELDCITSTGPIAFSPASSTNTKDGFTFSFEATSCENDKFTIDTKKDGVSINTSDNGVTTGHAGWSCSGTEPKTTWKFTPTEKDGNKAPGLSGTWTFTLTDKKGAKTAQIYTVDKWCEGNIDPGTESVWCESSNSVVITKLMNGKNYINSNTNIYSKGKIYTTGTENTSNIEHCYEICLD